MNILNVERALEESLANLATTALPAALEGLRHLPVGDRVPQVNIRYQRDGRKVRSDADASYFVPESCEVVIRFESSTDGRHESGAVVDDGGAEGFDVEVAVNQLVLALENVENTIPFVGLNWFRDHVLPGCGHDWSHDLRTRHLLLRHATDQRLVLTCQVADPDPPHHAVTAVRVNRRHPSLQADTPGRAREFKPVRIRGGSISDTVLGDRR